MLAIKKEFYTESLSELIEQAINEQERTTLTYKGKVFIAIIPIEDTQLAEKIEDLIDLADIDDIKKDKGLSTSLTDLMRELGQ